MDKKIKPRSGCVYCGTPYSDCPGYGRPWSYVTCCAECAGQGTYRCHLKTGAPANTEGTN